MNWYTRISSDLTVIPDFISQYEDTSIKND